jgi:hypothetical protein
MNKIFALLGAVLLFAGALGEAFVLVLAGNMCLAWAPVFRPFK